MTAEGEHIPVRVESLDIGYIDGMLCAHTLRLRMHLLYMCLCCACTDSSTVINHVTFFCGAGCCR